MATLVANSAGVISGQFTIPALIPAGAKSVRVLGGGGQAGVTSFTGRGTIRIEERRRVTSIVTENFFIPTGSDPLAQTFTLEASRHIVGLDLWFTNRGTSDVIVQIRDTATGFPAKAVLAEKRIASSEINIGGASTRVLFDTPVWLDAGTEFAFVVLCDNATAAMALAELGKYDATAQKWITSQAYQVGTMLSSSNASTWTAHQDKDLAFRLLGAKFSATSRTLALGVANVADMSDLMSLFNVDIPATGTSMEITATAPGGEIYRMGAGSPVKLPSRVNGNVTLAALMTGTQTASPVLYPGIQFVAGDMEESGTYVSRAFPVGTTARISVTFEALTPGTSSVAVEIERNDGSWQTIALTDGVEVGDGWVERSYILPSFTATQTRVRLTLTGTAAARPRVRKLRAVSTD